MENQKQNELIENGKTGSDRLVVDKNERDALIKKHKLIVDDDTQIVIRKKIVKRVRRNLTCERCKLDYDSRNNRCSCYRLFPDKKTLNQLYFELPFDARNEIEKFLLNKQGINPAMINKLHICLGFKNFTNRYDDHDDLEGCDRDRYIWRRKFFNTSMEAEGNRFKSEMSERTENALRRYFYKEENILTYEGMVTNNYQTDDGRPDNMVVCCKKNKNYYGGELSDGLIKKSFTIQVVSNNELSSMIADALYQEDRILYINPEIITSFFTRSRNGKINTRRGRYSAHYYPHIAEEGIIELQNGNAAMNEMLLNLIDTEWVHNSTGYSPLPFEYWLYDYCMERVYSDVDDAEGIKILMEILYGGDADLHKIVRVVKYREDLEYFAIMSETDNWC